MTCHCHTDQSQLNCNAYSIYFDSMSWGITSLAPVGESRLLRVRLRVRVRLYEGLQLEAAELDLPQPREVRLAVRNEKKAKS